MSELLIAMIPALMLLAVVLAQYFSSKSKNKLDDQAAKLLEDNREFITSELVKLAKQLEKTNKKSDDKDQSRN